MIQKIKTRRFKKIGRFFLQSIFYLGSIMLMVYVGYSKDKDKNWSLIKEIQHSRKKQQFKGSTLGLDSTNFTVSWGGSQDAQLNKVFDK